MTWKRIAVLVAASPFQGVEWICTLTARGLIWVAEQADRTRLWIEGLAFKP